MAQVTAFEARTRFGELLERVAKGEEVVITRQEKPVARLIPEGAQRLMRSGEASTDAYRSARRRRLRPHLEPRRGRWRLRRQHDRGAGECDDEGSTFHGPALKA